MAIDPALAVEPIRGSRREYEKLVELGVFEDERLELLYGQPLHVHHHVDHATISSWRLSIALGMDDDIRGHCPYAATDDSEPEPDVTVSKRRSTPNHPSHPLRVVEVSDSSIRDDRNLETRPYAEAAAPEYGIVDISDEELLVHVHTLPKRGRGTRVETYRTGEILQPTKLPGVEIAIADFPR